MAMAKSPAAPSPVADFETSLDALEKLGEQMEHGDMSLEESLEAYESGGGHYRRRQSALEQAELRVRLLGDPEDPATAQRCPAPDAWPGHARAPGAMAGAGRIHPGRCPARPRHRTRAPACRHAP